MMVVIVVVTLQLHDGVPSPTAGGLDFFLAFFQNINHERRKERLNNCQQWIVCLLVVMITLDVGWCWLLAVQ